MKTAVQIMNQKRFIKAELDRQLPKKQSDDLWREATKRLDGILGQFASLPPKARMHPVNFIFPAAAIYLTVREAAGEEIAYAVIENAAIANTAPMGRKLARLMKIPGMQSLFVGIWDPMTKKMFGAENGFQNVFYPKKKGEYRMDIVACPYCRYFTELGCPELTKIYCDNDERIYGNLPGLSFIRTTTLGKGGERCDFYIRKL